MNRVDLSDAEILALLGHHCPRCGRPRSFHARGCVLAENEGTTARAKLREILNESDRAREAAS